MATCDIDTLISDAVTNKFTSLSGDLAAAVRLQLLCDLQSQVGGGNLVKVLAVHNTAVAHTGTTAETTLFTTAVPGGTLGPNGFLRITLGASKTANTNVKRHRVRLGGSEIASSPNNASAASLFWQRTIVNRNSESSQKAFGQDAAGSFQETNATYLDGSVDTSVDQTLTVTIALANAADTFALEQVLVEYAYMP